MELSEPVQAILDKEIDEVRARTCEAVVGDLVDGLGVDKAYARLMWGVRRQWRLAGIDLQDERTWV